MEPKIWHKRTHLQNINRLKHQEQIRGCQGGEGRKEDGLGVWGWQMPTITFRMDK